MSLLSCAELAEIQLKADNMWADNRLKPELEANSVTAQFLLKNTTATITELQGAKDREIGVKWLNTCDAGTQNCTDDCVNETVREMAAGCKTMTMDYCQESLGFRVEEKDLRNKVFEVQELIARGLLGEVKALDEWWAEQAVAFIEASRGVNQYTGPYSNSGGDTQIPAAAMNFGLVSYLNLVKVKNKFTSPGLLTGTNMYQAWQNAQWNSGNDNGKGDAARIGVFPIDFDLFNIDAFNDPALKTYFIDRGAIAMGTKTYYPGKTMVNPFDRQRFGQIWEMPSKTLPGVMYEVYYNVECVNNKYYHTFKLKTYGGLWLNPLGCNEDVTGVISLACA